MPELVIDDGNWQSHLSPPPGQSTGLIERDYAAFPQGCYSSAPPFKMPTIPRNEWSDRIKQMESEKSRLSDIRMRGNNGTPIPSLDQNGKGYCWAHSPTSAVMMLRAAMNEPYVPLSAYAIACIIKNYRDEGGWGAQALDFITTRGVPSQAFWPQKSMSAANDRPATWENAALHKVTEGWVDLNAAIYDRDLTFDQVATCLLSRCPVVMDLNWWGHSVCGLDLVETSPGQFGVRILNSWSDSWGETGMGVLTGSKAIPDGAVAPRVVGASDT